jgi:anti-sigma factor RsiW
VSTCIEEGVIIRLVAGELPAEQRESAMGHVAGCPSCRKRYEEMKATWGALGVWQLAVPERDLSAAVLAAAGRRRRVPMPWMRMAAAVALAAGLGSALGFLVPWRSQQSNVGQVVSGQEVADRIGLDALGGESLGLADLFAVEADEGFNSGEGRS